MSHQLGRAVSEILVRYFGEIVQVVGNDMFKYGCRPISAIVRSTGLTRAQVLDTLRSLLKFDLATFEPSANEAIADYKILPENVLLMIRYPRYLLHIKSKYGSEAELIIEELLQHGLNTATRLLVNLAKKYKDDKEKNITIISLKEMFVSLATAGYIQQAPVPEMKEGSEVPSLVAVATIVPELDSRTLLIAMSDETIHENDNIYWKVNFDRFHQEFRDEIVEQAMSRRIDDHAGEVTRHLLAQTYLHSSPWAPTSNPIPIADLKQCCRRAPYEQYLDHYLRVLEENGSGWVRRSGEAGGGQIVVNMRCAATSCLYALLEHTVTERLGDKAARIFRLVRAKKYIEEDDIQKYAMLPNKECKELTHKLLEEHFITVHPMRKAGASSGMMKAIYLYHINTHEVAQTALEMCYRSLHNVAARSRSERAVSARLLDKARRVRSIVHSMRLRSEPQQNIDDVEETISPGERASLADVQRRLKQLSTAELQLDRALFLIAWYNRYKHHLL